MNINKGNLHLAAGDSGETELCKQLAKLHFDLNQVAAKILRTNANTHSTGEIASSGPDAAKKHAVHSMVRSRANRYKFVPSDLLADPAWDILLDLYSAYLSQIRISVSSLCLASNVPATTGLRWIKTLEHQGFIKRHGDPLDGRRYFMELTEAGLKAMNDYFASEAATHHAPAAA